MNGCFERAVKKITRDEHMIEIEVLKAENTPRECKTSTGNKRIKGYLV